MDSRCSRPAPGLGGFRSGLSANQVLILLAFTISACGGGGGGSGFQEGKGFPGDTDYADSVIRPYYVNNGLMDPTVPPGTVLPATYSNQSLLTANVPNQGEPGTCATVSFAQLVYGADVAQKAANPLLESVQFSYLFARFLEKNGPPGRADAIAASASGLAAPLFPLLHALTLDLVRYARRRAGQPAS